MRWQSDMIRRVYLALTGVLFIVGLLCSAQAQLQNKAIGGHSLLLEPSAAAAPASIAFVGAADGGNATATSLTFSYTVGSGSGRLLVVAVVGDGSVDDVTGVTYAGSAMTLAAKLAPGGGSNRWAYLFWKATPTSGANNVVISASTSHFLAGGAADYTGVNASGQPDATATQADGVTNTLTTSITTVANNSWAILLENSFNGNIAPTAGAGLTLRVADAAFGAWGIFDSNGAITPAGSYSMTTNRTSSVTTIDHVAASFKP